MRYSEEIPPGRLRAPRHPPSPARDQCLLRSYYRLSTVPCSARFTSFQHGDAAHPAPPTSRRLLISISDVSVRPTGHFSRELGVKFPRPPGIEASFDGLFGQKPLVLRRGRLRRARQFIVVTALRSLEPLGHLESTCPASACHAFHVLDLSSR